MREVDLNKARLELALEAAGLDLWENDLRTGEVTRKAVKVFEELGFTGEEVAAHVQGIFGLVHPDDLPRVRKAIDDHLLGVSPQCRCEFRVRTKDGLWVWYANYGRIMDAGDSTSGKRFIGVTFNIDDRKRQEDELAQINRQLVEQNALLQQLNTTLGLLAAKDSLTGLSNRRTLMELGASECRRAERYGHPLSVMVVDIDLFKSINDVWGHFAGDRVICAVADACAARTRAGVDIVARFGGEEFVLVLPETDGPSALCLAESLRQRVVAQQVAVNEAGTCASVSVSIGVATLALGVGQSFEQLVNWADKALYNAKEAGRNSVQHCVQD